MRTDSEIAAVTVPGAARVRRVGPGPGQATQGRAAAALASHSPNPSAEPGPPRPSSRRLLYHCMT